jgi:hypothetical protein
MMKFNKEQLRHNIKMYHIYKNHETYEETLNELVDKGLQEVHPWFRSVNPDNERVILDKHKRLVIKDTKRIHNGK